MGRLAKAENSKYPEWKKRIGQFRVDKIKAKYERLGYKVTTFAIEDEGVDMIAENDDEIILLEITNWNIKGYLSPKRIKNMENNWLEAEKGFRRKGEKRNIRRRLVYSHIENIHNVIRFLLEVEAELEEIGYQDLPPEDKLEGWI